MINELLKSILLKGLEKPESEFNLLKSIFLKGIEEPELDFHNPDDFKKYVNRIIDMKKSCEGTLYESWINPLADELYKKGYELYQKCQEENNKKDSEEDEEHKEFLRRISLCTPEGLEKSSIETVENLVKEYIDTILKPNVAVMSKGIDIPDSDKAITVISDELKSMLFWILKNK